MMIGLLKALGVAKTVAAVSLLTAATAFAAHAALPAASTQGQAHATAGSANATTSRTNLTVSGANLTTTHVDAANEPRAKTHVDATAGTDATTGTRADVHAILVANKARLLAHLEDVLARLTANHANSHALAAIQRHITDLTTGTSGLDRAIAAVGRSHGAGHPSNSARPDLTIPPNSIGRPTAR